MVAKEVVDALDEAEREGEALNAERTGEDLSEGVDQIMEESGVSEVTASQPSRTRKAKQSTAKTKSAREIHEATFLTRFAKTSDCLRNVWDVYFGNHKKGASTNTVTCT